FAADFPTGLAPGREFRKVGIDGGGKLQRQDQRIGFVSGIAVNEGLDILVMLPGIAAGTWQYDNDAAYAFQAFAEFMVGVDRHPVAVLGLAQRQILPC